MPKAHFMDFELETEMSTFSPRFETELLVEKAIEIAEKENDRKTYNILDICTGCGNIAISLTKYIPSSTMVALDISDTALSIAEENSKRYKLDSRISFINCDILRDELNTMYNSYFDLIISNPPYITFEDFRRLSGEVKHDPYIALYGGKDGLDFYKKIAEKSTKWLRDKGHLLMEIGYDQGESVPRILEETNKLSDIEVYKDYSGIERIVKAKKWTN